MFLLFASCALKSAPDVGPMAPTVKFLIAENEWIDEGLQVTVDIQTSANGPAFDHALLLANAQEYPIGFAQPIEGMGFRLNIILPLEHEAGQYVEGQVWLKGVEQSFPFDLVTPFEDEDSHDSH